MNDQTDQQLLREYTEQQSETAFAAIVYRYTDLVYSAASRMVCDLDAAKDVTQSVFVALARNAHKLTDRPALAGWLHGTTRNLAAKVVRSDVSRRTREQEAAAMNQLLSAEADAPWEQIAPQFDDALSELSEPDREALMLRYFKNHDFRTVGVLLGISDDAAQKRVSRAVEKLREFFTKRKITIGAGGLTLLISANAVQSAPVGLAATISTAAVAGTAITTSTMVATTKIIAMTTLQKTLITLAVAALASAGIYEASRAANARAEAQTLQQQQTSLTGQIQRLENERNEASNKITSLSKENEQLTRNAGELPQLRSELLRLRNEVGTLRQQVKAGSAVEADANANYWPRDSWKFAGYDSPDAALQTYFWAARTGDVATFQASITGEALKTMTNGNSEQWVQAFTSSQAAGLKSVRVLQRELQDDDTAVLTAVFEKETGNEVRRLLLNKVGTEWKFSAYMSN